MGHGKVWGWGREGVIEGVRLFGFAEEDAVRGGFAVQG